MRRRMQMVFQDPMASLDPRQSVESVLTEPLARPRDRGKAATRRPGPRAARPGRPASRRPRGRYPHEFSGGQRQRIGIARAIALDPDLIIADEPVSALDVSIQAQVVNLLEELQERLGLTYVVIAHDLAVVRHIADVVAVMYLGSDRRAGAVGRRCTPSRCTRTPKALMSAVPIPDPVVEDTGASGSCCPATCRRRRTRRPAAGSTPAVRTGSRPAATTSGRRCGSSRPATPSPATGPRTSPQASIAPRAEAVVDAATDEAAAPSRPSARRAGDDDLGPPPGDLSGQRQAIRTYSVVIARSTSSRAARCAGHSAASTPTTPANRTKMTS